MLFVCVFLLLFWHRRVGYDRSNTCLINSCLTVYAKMFILPGCLFDTSRDDRCCISLLSNFFFEISGARKTWLVCSYCLFRVCIEADLSTLSLTLFCSWRFSCCIFLEFWRRVENSLAVVFAFWYECDVICIPHGFYSILFHTVR
jgi:hypothetical protein